MDSNNKITSKKRILVTGGAGFIASHLIERLVKDNTVTVFDNLKRNSLQYTELGKHPNLTIIEGDVLDATGVDNAMADMDLCVHAAAIAGIYSVGHSTIRTMKVNFLGTYHALEAAIKHRVKRFLDFSTSEVYGPFVYRGKESDQTTQGPVGEKRWVYAISKLAGEHLAHAYAHEHGLEVITLRPFNVYGPRQVGEGAIQQMIGRAIRNEDIVVYNDGTQIRSWCYVDDFVDALYQALFREAAAGKVFNLGNPQATVTILGLAKMIVRLTNSKSRVVFRPHPGPEVEMRVPDISSAKETLGFNPMVDLEDGLLRSIAWYSAHQTST